MDAIDWHAAWLKRMADGRRVFGTEARHQAFLLRPLVLAEAKRRKTQT